VLASCVLNNKILESLEVLHIDDNSLHNFAPKRYLYRSFDLFSILDFSYSSENLATMTVTGRARTMSPAKRASVPNTIPREDSGNMSPYARLGLAAFVLVREFGDNDGDGQCHQD